MTIISTVWLETADHFGFSVPLTKKVYTFRQKVPRLVHREFYCACTGMVSFCLKVLIYGVKGTLKVSPKSFRLQNLVEIVLKRQCENRCNFCHRWISNQQLSDLES